MKATLFSILALTSAVLAVPTEKEHKKIYDDCKPGKDWPKKEYFTSTYRTVATPDQIINGTSGPVPGEKGALGFYNFGINSKDEVICYDIILKGVSGEYQSPALTASHIHQAAKGASGPPRVVFPDPVGDDKFRRSYGCIKGPFKTGVLANGVDTGVGFSLKNIEKNPSNYYVDTHTKKYVPGVVRGQMS